MDTSRYQRALKRNLAELSNAILERRALIAMNEAESTRRPPALSSGSV